ncbi:uncharacterized protein GIQ15_01770 [Arthroderma uncinatum]|uniref:uncharacterized protein n=1 Tax=Arthroderma uncinatum TaxID=74035 RepID=UPI00144A7D8B|nr:uncharacterized protein GIQ15_01770 [Arthroderma uncinatum]KAF3492253.1 hypothetical protein GIQ15_01770 [Arthroderma uncinatum]
MGKRKDAAAEWEMYKDDIKMLYKTKELPDLMALMKKRGFHRSVAQYKHKFKEWEFQKYSNQKEYEYMAHTEKKRKYENKDTEFNVRGKILGSEKLAKKLRRHLPKGYETVPLIEVGPSTPEGIQVLSPSAKKDDEVYIELALLPFFRFQQFLQQAVFSREMPHSYHFDFSAMTIDEIIPSSGSKSNGHPGRFLEAVIIGQTEDELRRSSAAIVHGPPADALFYTISYCAYLASNNLLTEDNLDRIVQWMVTNEKRLPLFDFLDLGSPTVTIFMRKLLKSTVRLGHKSLMRHLLQICLSSDNLRQILQSQEILYEAVKHNELELMTCVLDAGVCLESFTRGMWVIVENGYEKMLKLLISKGLNIHDTDQFDGWFEIAVEHDQAAIVQLLIDLKINDMDIKDETFFRVLAENEEMARLLVRAGVPIPLKFELGYRKISDCMLDDLLFFYPVQTPLQVAAQGHNWELVRDLVKHGASIDLGYTYISNTECEAWLANLEEEFNVDGVIPVCSALQAAVSYGNVEITLFLLQNGAKVDARPSGWYGHTALQIAVASGYKDLVELLLKWNADVNAGPGLYKGSTALQLAAGLRDLEIFEILLKKKANVKANPGKDGKTVLQDAAYAGNIRLVQFLLQDSYTDVHERPHPEGGRTALQAASVSLVPSSLEIVKLLLSAGADSNAPPAEKRGITALQGAAATGNIAKAELLLAANAQIELCSAQYGCTALHMAIRGRHLEMVALLLHHGATPHYDASAISGRTPLQEACLNGDIQIASLLLSSIPRNLHALFVNVPATFNSGVTALQAAVESGNFKLIKLLLDLGADPNAPGAVVEGNSALGIATVKQDFKALRVLLENGAQFSADWKLIPSDLDVTHSIVNVPFNLDYRAMPSSYIDLRARASVSFYAKQKDRFREFVSLVVGSGLDIIVFPRVFLKTALAFAIYSNDLRLIDVLLSSDVLLVEATIADCSCLQRAASIGNIESVKIFVERGADVNNENEGTALWRAAENGHFEVVKYLLEHGAEIESHTSGRSALQIAARNGHEEVVRYLVELHGADVNAPECESFRLTALQTAAEHGHVGIVKYLLEHGANVNAPAYHNAGMTALQAAAYTGHAGILSILLDAGADVTAARATWSGTTAIEGAAWHGRLDILHMLLQIHPPDQHLAAQLRRAKERGEEADHPEICRAIREYQKSHGWLDSD